MIFGKIPPIYDVHMKIRDNLNELINDWDESCMVGDIFVKQVRLSILINSCFSGILLFCLFCVWFTLINEKKIHGCFYL